MSEEKLTKIFQMISAAGTARTKYIEAVRAAKEFDFDRAKSLTEEGGDCFHMAHEIHGEFLALASADLEAEGTSSDINLILIHAEDQMMCAETVRLMAEELVDVYRTVKSSSRA